jgi:hypothetical protein
MSRQPRKWEEIDQNEGSPLRRNRGVRGGGPSAEEGAERLPTAYDTSTPFPPFTGS